MNVKELEKVFENWNLKGRYEILKEIGAGSYGHVVKAKDLRTGQEVAIKRITKVFDDLVDGKRILREIALLKRLKHPNIVNLVDIFVPNNDLENFNELCVVLEYAPSDMKKILRRNIFLSEKDVIRMIYNCTLGLNYIHSACVWHRDLKPANVLVFDNGLAKICDFGLARTVEESFTAKRGEAPGPSFVLQKIENKVEAPKSSKLKRAAPRIQTKLTSHVVTRWYRAPEIILIEKNYDNKIDMWSLGCIFAEMLQMQKENAANFLERKAFFAGHSCFPLSPDAKAPMLECGFPVATHDQLREIINKLGTPNKNDLQFITDPNALEYIACLPQVAKKTLSDFFPTSSKDVIDFLTGCLTFNPTKRLSVSEALNHPVFKDVRNIEAENIIEKTKLHFDFEDEQITETKQLRKYFVKEISKK